MPAVSSVPAIRALVIDDSAYNRVTLSRMLETDPGIQVVGIDGTDFARAEILKGGPFIASVAQDFDGMAKQLVEIVAAQLDGKAPESNLVTIGGVLITKENAK